MSLQELEKLDSARPETMEKSLKSLFTCSENILSPVSSNYLVRHQGFRDERHVPFPHQAHSPGRDTVSKSLQPREVLIGKFWVQRESPEVELLTQGSEKVPQREQHLSRLYKAQSS